LRVRFVVRFRPSSACLMTQILAPGLRRRKQARPGVMQTFPNVEVTGPRRRGALAARRMIDNERLAARVPCRSGSS
jgi:hypothetical protein